MKYAAIPLFLAVAAISCAANQSPVEREATIERGARDFGEHCASCHGRSARGDGPVAEILAIPVPDLTGLSQEENGRFPARSIRWIIDGRADVLAHGPREMPIWGNEFRREKDLVDLPALQPQEKDVQRRIDDLVAYIKSIQRLKG